MMTRRTVPARIGIAAIALIATVFSIIHPFTNAAALSGSDWQAGRIIDDSVFNYSNSMSVQEIQNFLNAKVPTCDNWGTKIYSGSTTRRAYSESKGITMPLTCVKDYYENPTTKQNNLSGQPIPAGALSAAQIIWQAGQQYSINPQVLIILLHKEQSLIQDDWPWPIQYQSATGYGCPDTAACDSTYYGFYNQVTNAAKQFRRYANQPNSYNFAAGTAFVQYNPNASCGGTNVLIQNQATASLYNYTPYQPNQAALNNLYGTGDGCSAYGNRNFWRMYNDWFGSTLIFDPFGWSVIKTANDSKTYLKVGNTKRWIPSGDLYNDWKLSNKPTEVVSQDFLDSIPTLPQLDRLGFFNNKYYYVDGGKKYWLSNDELIKAWGQSSKLALAVPAYVPLSNMQDGGEATFYVAQGTNLGRLVNGQIVSIINNDGDRWNANPTAVTAATFGSFGTAATVDYHLSINGTKYIVDNGGLLDVTDATIARDYGQAGATYVPVSSEVTKFLPIRSSSSLVRVGSDPAWYLLRSSKLYYVSKGEAAEAWGYSGQPALLSSRLAGGYLRNTTPLSTTVSDQSTGKIYLIDGTKHLLTGAAAAAIQTSNSAQPFASPFIAAIPDGNDIASPLVKTERGDIFSLMNGGIFHVPSGTVLTSLGYPQKYDLAPISSTYINANGISGVSSIFVKNSAGTSYSLQNGSAYPIDPAALADWTTGNVVPVDNSTTFAGRYDVKSSTLSQYVQVGTTQYLISNGAANPVSAAYVGSGQTWTPIQTMTLPINGSLSYIVRSTDTTDPRVWLIVGGRKYYIATPNTYNAFTKRGTAATSYLSPSLLNRLPQVPSASGDVSPLLYLDGSGFKLLDENGRFYGFADGDTAVNFITNNPNQPVNADLYGNFNGYRQNISRLVRDPSGKVYWVEAGQKRWITNGTAYNRYAGTPLTDIDTVVANWLPNGSPIN